MHAVANEKAQMVVGEKPLSSLPRFSPPTARRGNATPLLPRLHHGGETGARSITPSPISMELLLRTTHARSYSFQLASLKPAASGHLRARFNVHKFSPASLLIPRPRLPFRSPPAVVVSGLRDGGGKRPATTEVGTMKKVVPLGVMFFLILYNFTILRDTKDVLVITASGSSAEIIPFLKTWVNLPMAMVFMVAYTRLSHVLSREALFYACMLPFLAFFPAFAFLLYPNSHRIHPVGVADRLLAALGPSFAGPIAILRIWSFCLFYVMAELWGNVVVSLLFWGFANQITTVEEASQFYPMFGLVANISLVFSGCTVKHFSNLRENLGPGVDGWGHSLRGMMSIVVLFGLLICCIYWIMNAFILSDSSTQKPDNTKQKMKMGVVKSMEFLLTSRYIRDIATLVIAYGVTLNLVEVTWKSKLKAQFPSPTAYASLMGDLSTCTGVATFLLMLLNRFIIRAYGWGATAAITPTVVLVTGVAFFSLDVFSSSLSPLLAEVGISPVLAAIYIGAFHNIFSKSSKYSLFDPCKEMAYIPLDEETKMKGKAAIEMVCCPLGKSGGALIQQFLILKCGSLSNSTPYLGGALLVIVFGWLATTRSLDQQFTPLARKQLRDGCDQPLQLNIPPSYLQFSRRARPWRGVGYHLFLNMADHGGFVDGSCSWNCIGGVSSYGAIRWDHQECLIEKKHEMFRWSCRGGWKWIG